jgi:hypothetical protein
MNSSFSPHLPTLQFAWDSTSLSALKECPRKYYYSIVLGYQSKHRSFHLDFGIFYHEALEAYDRAKALGSDHEASCVAAVRRALVSSWNTDLNRPWISGDNYKNRFTLIRTIVWYLEQFRDDPIETIILAGGQPAVELSFRYNFPHHFSSTGEDAIYCGHLDRLGSIGGGLWVVDRKTTQHAIDDRYFQRYSPDNQMSAYAYAGKIVYNIPVQGVIVDAAQVLVTFSRFRRGFANRTDSQLAEWQRDAGYYIAQAELYATSNYWPQNDKSCFNYGGCPYREICARSPEVRERWLEANYVKRVWDPLVTRGDV